MLDLDEEKVVDLHCFAFSDGVALSKKKLLEFFAFGGPTVKGVSARLGFEEQSDSFALRYFIKSLSRFLGCEPSLDAVVEARNKRAKDYKEYLTQLFEDAGIEALVLDNGLYQESEDSVRTHAPCAVYKVLRLEPLIAQLIDGSDDFEHLVSAYTKRLSDSVTKEGFKGFKSIIAYRTGLGVRIPSVAEAKADFRAAKSRGAEAWFGPVAKSLRDYLFGLAAEVAGRLKVVFEVHTGLGDTDILGSQSNPILLENVLKQRVFSDTDVILIHGGYPYSEEAAWMARVFPKVSLEFSTPFPPCYLPPMSESRLLQTLQVTPPAKIVYGSDGHGLPEFHWLSAKTAKRGLALALDEFMANGIIQQETAVTWARMILSGNSKRLLGVDQ